MRFLFFLDTGYPPEATGGVQINTHELAQALIARGHVAVVLASRPAALRGDADSDEIYAGYRLIRAANPAARIKSLAPSLDIDVAILQTASRIVPAIVECLDLALPCVVYMHNVETHGWGGHLMADPEILYLSVSTFVAGRVQALFGVESQVVLPFIDTALHRIVASEITPSGGKVLFVNPHPLKGVEIFIAAAQRLPRIPFIVAETWEIGDAWRRQCFRRVAAVGNVDWRYRIADMRTVWRDTRLLFMPSVWEEAWGRVASEAQINGIPAVASTRGGLPEAVGPGGLLLDAHAPVERWVETLARAWDDTAEYARLSAAARSHAARAEIQPAAVAGRFIELVEAHVAASRARRA